MSGRIGHGVRRVTDGLTPSDDRGVTPTEILPLLIVTLLLVSIGGADVERMDVTFAGDHDVTAIDDLLVVGGGDTTIAGRTTSDSAVSGDLYVIGGHARIDGRLDGDVTVLAGNLTVADGATVTGTVDLIAGDAAIADGASIGTLSRVDALVPEPSPVRQLGGLLLRALVLGLAGAVLVRRRPRLLDNVGHAVTDHPLVSGAVGSLAALTLLVLFVYMAFTILLLPVAIAGLLGELLVVLFGQVVFGYLLGRRLPVREDVATVAGVVGFLLAVELLGLVPYLGAIVQLGLVAVGFGAVVTTYFGLARFEPASIPPGGTG